MVKIPPIQEVKADIHYYLIIGDYPHLAECLDMVPEEYLVALYKMICAHLSRKTYKGIIAYEVGEDVAMIVTGRASDIDFSKEYL